MSDVHNQSGRAVAVSVNMQPHPNSDSLALVQVGAYQVVVKRSDFELVALGIFIPPDSMVPLERTEFAWLEKNRIKVRRFRGQVSEGMLIPAPLGATVDQDFTEELGITRYERSVEIHLSGEEEAGPELSVPRFDVEALKKFPGVFQPGEPIVITEKIHGANARFVHTGGRLYVGSRNQFKKDGDNVWWTAVRRNPWLADWCAKNPDFVVFGEVFGWVQDLTYGRSKGEVDIVVFDVFDLKARRWWNTANVHTEFLDYSVPWIGAYRFDLSVILDLADGVSKVLGADHMREGIVLRPLEERTDPALEVLGGRVIAKVVSNNYLERAQ